MAISIIGLLVMALSFRSQCSPPYPTTTIIVFTHVDFVAVTVTIVVKTAMPAPHNSFVVPKLIKGFDNKYCNGNSGNNTHHPTNTSKYLLQNYSPPILLHSSWIKLVRAFNLLLIFLQIRHIVWLMMSIGAINTVTSSMPHSCNS